jgi:peptide/nickel transport system substrate-binding protein
MGDPPSMVMQKTTPVIGSVPGLDAFEELVHAGLTHFDTQGNALPQLAEAVPSLDTGTWRLLPDGRMETTWRIRADARWHDGTPVTTEDLFFTMRAEQDPEIEIPKNPVYQLVEGVEAPDSRTLTLRWAAPYIEADAMFSYQFALPWPRHILERIYQEDKAALLQAPFWGADYVGAGPYRVKEWVRGSHAILTAYDQYVLGRPKIEEIEVKFVTDANTLMANVIAGGIDFTIGRGLGIDQGLQIRDQWRDGKVETYSTSWLPIHPQFVGTTPAVVGNVVFRRALLHAIDRQDMADTLMAGLTPIAHGLVSPDQAAYREVESSMVRYDYDVRRATSMIESLGYSKGADGTFRDSAGLPLSLELRTTAQLDIQPRSNTAVADFWRRLGITVEELVVPNQRIPDREYRANFPAFELVVGNNGTTSRDLRRFHSTSSPLAENRYTAFGNYARYKNPEFDNAIDRYVTTIPRGERMRALGDVMHHQTDQVTALPLFYVPAPTAIASRLSNAGPRGRLSTESWNAHDWDVTRQ